MCHPDIFHICVNTELADPLVRMSMVSNVVPRVLVGPHPGISLLIDASGSTKKDDRWAFFLCQALY